MSKLRFRDHKKLAYNFRVRLSDHGSDSSLDQDFTVQSLHSIPLFPKIKCFTFIGVVFSFKPANNLVGMEG